MFLPVGTEEENARRSFPIVTWLLVGLNLLVFVIELAMLYAGGEDALAWFTTAFGLIPAAVTSRTSILIPYYLTPLTAMFIHGSLSHIGFNMLYLGAFGDNVEDRLGHWRYLLFYLATGLVASGVQIIVDPSSQLVTIGASGAIAGVLAGYALLFPEGRVRMFIFAGPLTRIRRAPALLYLLIWFAMQFFNGVGTLGVRTAETGGVAYWAHIGGFAAGLVLGGIFRWILEPRNGKERLETAA